MVKYSPFLVTALLFLCGCSSSKKAIITESLDAVPVVSGSVVDPAALKQGGTLVLGDFQAGPGAAADDVTDQLSLVISKAIMDTLPRDKTPFIIQRHHQSPDCFLEGYIVNYGRKTDFPLGHNQVYLSVEGNIWLRRSGEKILLFQSSGAIDLKTQDPNMVAYQMGVAIAHFIGRISS